MRNSRHYQEDIDSVAGYIKQISSDDNLKQFIEECDLSIEDFRRPSGGFSGVAAAVDGSNAMILESGSFSVAALRAVSVAFKKGERYFAKTTPLRLPRLSAADVSEEYKRLYRECFDKEPQNPVEDDPSRAASVFRDTLEYWAAKQTINELDKGDCLMLDGSLRTSHASHDPVISDIVRDCGNRGIYLISISKRNSLTWNGLPLGITLDAAASELGIGAPWYIEVPDNMPDQKRHEQWHRGRTYIIRMHNASGIVLKAEIPKYADEVYVEKAISACADYSGDGRIPGYPYPLMEAHRECCITQEIADIIRQDIIRKIDGIGYDLMRYNQLFGDIHDEFSKY